MIDEENGSVAAPSSLVKICKSCSNSDIRLMSLCLICLVIVSIMFTFQRNGSPTHEVLKYETQQIFNARRFLQFGVRNSTSSSWNYNWDSRDPHTHPIGSPFHGNIEATRTLVLIRHGQYDSTGQLTALGRQQAEMTGKRLKEMGWIYDEIIHSTMIRAAQTARIIAKHLKGVPMKHDPLLREGGPVPPDPTVAHWQLPNLDYFLDGPRIETSFRKYFHRADPSQKNRTNQILVGHSNIFKYFILRTLQFPRAGWMRFFIPHSSITVLSIAPDGTVSSGHIGDAGYMPVNMVTY